MYFGRRPWHRSPNARRALLDKKKLHINHDHRGNSQKYNLHYIQSFQMTFRTALDSQHSKSDLSDHLMHLANDLSF